MNDVKVKLAKGGVVALPAEYREALHWHEGDELRVTLDRGGLRILSVTRAIEQAQALVRQYTPEGRSLATELISERRLEAESE